MLFEKIEKRRPNRLSNLEYLGLDMVQAGNEFGPGTAYGKFALFLYLVKTSFANCFAVYFSIVLFKSVRRFKYMQV